MLSKNLELALMVLSVRSIIMRFFFKGISRLIEADVSVPADTEQLHVHASGLPDDFVILRTCLIAASVRQALSIFTWSKKIMIHKINYSFWSLSPESPLYSSKFTLVTLEKSRSPLYPFYQLHAHRVEPVASPRTASGFMIICADMILAAFLLTS